MAAKKGIEGIREYFTDEEWSSMPDSTKERYANFKENYDLMVKLGLGLQVLKFMKPPSRPAEKKGERDAPSSMAGETADMELGRGPALDTMTQSDDGSLGGTCTLFLSVMSEGSASTQASSIIVKDGSPMHRENTTATKSYGHVDNLQASSSQASLDFSPTKGAAASDNASCEICGEFFLSFEDFLEHELRQHAEEPSGKYKGSYCDYANNKYLTAQQEWSHSGEEPFPWQLCESSLSWKSSPQGHSTSPRREKPFECAECGARFTSSSHMLRHQTAHSKDARPFVCPICEKRYARRDYLKVHICTHTSEKQHACGVCGRKFTDRSNARKHELRVHAKQFPLSCPHCDKGFWSRWEVRRHVLAHHER